MGFQKLNNFVVPIMEVSIQKINVSLWLCNMKKMMNIFEHEEDDEHNPLDKKKEQGAEGRQTLKLEKALIHIPRVSL